MDDETVSIEGARGLRKSKSGQALLCDVGLDDPVWVPQSLISQDSEVYKPDGETGVLIIPEWWAVENGLV